MTIVSQLQLPFSASNMQSGGWAI